MEEINKLREETGACLMDCKRALSESNNNYEAAKIWLKEGRHLKGCFINIRL